MTKRDFISKVQENIELEVTKKDLNTILDGVINTIRDVVASGEDVSIAGFATFKNKEVAAKSGVTKLGGKETKWSTPKHNEVAVKLSKNYKAL